MSTGEEYGLPVVIDPGSNTVKAGLAGDDSPKVIFPNVVGRPKQNALGGPDYQKNQYVYVGEDAANKRGILSVKYPIAWGCISNWDDMEIVFSHTFSSELGVNPADHPVLLAEHTMNPRLNREMLTQVMFEKFNVPAFHLQSSAVLSLYAFGRTTGLVQECGGGATLSVPVYEGYALRHCMRRVVLSGGYLTDYLVQMLLEERSCDLTSSACRPVVNDMKHKLCFVSQDFKEDMKKAAESKTYEEKYELPDGTFVTLNSERFRCAEVYFDPTLVGIEMYGIHHDVLNTIQRADEDIRGLLFSNILLSGACSLFPGFGERLQKEIQHLAPEVANVAVFSPANRRHSAWTGGSILASMKSFSGSWISKDDYDEYGPLLVATRCF